MIRNLWVLAIMFLWSQVAISQGSWLTVQVQTDNYPEETSWKILSGEEIVAESPQYSEVQYDETLVLLPAGDYVLNFYDAFGDGICCAYGEGWFGLVNSCGLNYINESFGDVVSEVPFTLTPCALPEAGCTDEAAVNYNPEATLGVYTGLVDGGPIVTECNQGVWDNNYFGINLDFYLNNQDLFAIGTEIEVSGHSYFIDAMNIPGNCNQGVALVYVVYSEDQCDGNPFATYMPQALYNDVYVGDSWFIDPCIHIEGCVDELAINYNEEATQNDGSCLYILGCMDEEADNYNQAAVAQMPESNVCEYTTLDTTSCGVDSVEVIVDIVVDQYPSETAWFIKTNQGLTLAEAFPGDYTGETMGTLISTSTCIADFTPITFGITDTYGDGLGGAQWGGIDGSWTIYTACDTIGSGIGDFGEITIANGNVGDCDTFPEEGCMNSDYVEYNPDAVISIETMCLTPVIEGCTDENSINYDPNANTMEQGGACLHTLRLIDGSANGWGGSFMIVLQGDSTWGPFSVESGALFETELYLNSSELVKAFFYSDPLSQNFMIECGFEIIGPDDNVVLQAGNNPFLEPMQMAPYMYSGTPECPNICIPIIEGCQDELACNYNSNANVASDCVYAIEYYDCSNMCINDADNDGVCDELEVAGCMDPTMYNYNADATDAGECEEYVYGCTDPTMFNYNPDANTDNGSCEEIVYGCTNEEAFNYDPMANTDNDSCVDVVTDCMDPSAFNYNAEANTPDESSCLYDAGCYGGPGVPYWANDSCYSWVIVVDPYCCETDWDQSCVDLYDYCSSQWPQDIPELNSDITLYPNPTSTVLNVKAPAEAVTSLYNSFGQLVVVGTTEKRIDLSSLPNGIYEVVINNKDRILTQKIIKQ